MARLASLSGKRPRPPASLAEAQAHLFVPAPEVWRWVEQTLLGEDAPLRNPDHDHLRMAMVGVLWTNAPNTRRQRQVLGMAEMPNFRGDKWSRARQEQQLLDWFQALPDFMFTFDAGFCASCSDAEWCALVEHELYHCAQARDEYNAPKFTRDGRPVFAVRGHDVEEFTGVVRRYGAVSSHLLELVDAAQSPPTIAGASIALACGTCEAP